jgi:hypothetical protein
MVAIRIPFADMFLLDDLTHENVELALLAIAFTILMVSRRKRHASRDYWDLDKN